MHSKILSSHIKNTPTLVDFAFQCFPKSLVKVTRHFSKFNFTIMYAFTEKFKIDRKFLNFKIESEK